MPTSQTLAKAECYLAEGRVHLTGPDPNQAEVQGSQPEPYRLEQVDGKWRCDCPAKLTCAHILAVEMLEKGEFVMSFNPQEHMMKLKGKDYLMVMWRLVWFREVHPADTGWAIRTQAEEVTPQGARYRAQIVDPEGRIVAEGTKTETLKGFPDFVEKAETGSIGRALALCGFGTQFTGGELDEGERIVDSPVAQPDEWSEGQQPMAASHEVLDLDAASKGSAPLFKAVLADLGCDTNDKVRAVLRKMGYPEPEEGGVELAKFIGQMATLEKRGILEYLQEEAGR